MKKPLRSVVFVSLAMMLLLGVSGCQSVSTPPAALVGAWHGKVQFTTGMLATTKDMEFMYVFHADGTMTESSNYDGCPPGPPAYGAWKQTGPGQFEARYRFFWPKSLTSLDDLTKNGGWLPDGHGVLTQKFIVSADGDSFTSTIQAEMFDKQGKPIEGGGVGTAEAGRIRP